ncbi:PREDICTED: collagen alpha-1(I) chain-like [Lepidothrix coronata]|uniref:Collagen alpha-1(I) chain-like n=1 Tax=Lepidothrix coronata TaxID=321398 RepID=A0A6J0IDK0_9PASS|nr:PREDICTED: collagen alpha-1(I) chain-like [Lepidothrix coronata]
MFYFGRRPEGGVEGCPAPSVLPSVPPCARRAADGKVRGCRGRSKPPYPFPQGTPSRSLGGGGSQSFPPAHSQPRPRRAPLAPGQDQRGQTAPLRRDRPGTGGGDRGKGPPGKGDRRGTPRDRGKGPPGERDRGKGPPGERDRGKGPPGEGDGSDRDPDVRTPRWASTALAPRGPLSRRVGGTRSSPQPQRRFPPCPSRLPAAVRTCGGGGGGGSRLQRRCLARRLPLRCRGRAGLRRPALPFSVSGKLRALTQAVTGAGPAGPPGFLPPPGGALSQGRREAPPRTAPHLSAPPHTAPHRPAPPRTPAGTAGIAQPRTAVRRREGARAGGRPPKGFGSHGVSHTGTGWTPKCL